MVLEKKILIKPKIPLLTKISRRLLSFISNPYFNLSLRGFGQGSYIGLPVYLLGGNGIIIGKNVTIWSRNRLEVRHTLTSNAQLNIGDGTIIQPGGHIAAAHKIDIGNKVLIASDVYITDHDHALDFFNDGLADGDFKGVYTDSVSIEDHCWIGEKVCILKGVTIGYASIIGAGSVVTKNVPEYSIAVGNPAKVIKRYNKVKRVWEKNI